jgi:hypothetical protein
MSPWIPTTRLFSLPRILVACLALASLPVIFIAMFAADLLIVAGPRILEILREPSAQSECDNVREGMTREQALNTIAHDLPPELELYDTQGRISFWRRTGGCVVEFNRDTGRVSKRSSVSWSGVPIAHSEESFDGR